MPKIIAMKHITYSEGKINEPKPIRLLLVFILLISILEFYACTKNSAGTPPPPPADSVDVYIAGTEYGGLSTVYSYAEIWKNGKLTNLSDGTKSEYVNGIFVSNGDVYLAGEELDGFTFFGKYWKNGVPTVFTDSMSHTTGIAVSGNDVYVTGYSLDLTTYHSVAEFWKNGTLFKLTADTSDAAAIAIAISGGDVYIAGIDRGVFKLWVNGVLRDIPNSTIPGTIRSLYVLGNDVYVTGNDYDPVSSKNTAAYWKNGAEVKLTNGSLDSYANSIVVSGTDVYVAGLEAGSSGTNNAARYWKNGQQVNLADIATQNVIANAIAVHGNDVYVSASGNNTINYWLNGKSVSLGSGAEHFNSSCIFVSIR